jgi:hypothetical protein
MGAIHRWKILLFKYMIVALSVLYMLCIVADNIRNITYARKNDIIVA